MPRSFTNEVLGTKGLGRKMSHILQTEEEFETEAPELETPRKTIKPDEEGHEEHERQRRSWTAMRLDPTAGRSLKTMKRLRMLPLRVFDWAMQPVC